MIYRYIYKITCLCGDWKNKYYYGQHTTDNLDDGYAGSGVRINQYYAIYGKSCLTYKKKILRFCYSQEELDQWEAYYVNKHLSKEKCLNIDEGGKHYLNNNKLDFHVVETLDDGTYRSAEINENTILYSKINGVPIYQTKNGKLYSKAIDLQKHGINFY